MLISVQEHITLLKVNKLQFVEKQWKWFTEQACTKDLPTNSTVTPIYHLQTSIAKTTGIQQGHSNQCFTFLNNIW